jgi:hypothetical protein
VSQDVGIRGYFSKPEGAASKKKKVWETPATTGNGAQVNQQ